MRILKALAAAGTIAMAAIYFAPSNNVSSREEFESFLENHPYNKTNYTDAELKAMPKKDRPDLAFQQDFLRTLDPKLGRPATERLLPILEELRKSNSQYSSQKTTAINWTERGPNNVGGRTRAIMFDPNDSTGKKVWAGAVAGGMWYSNDITQFNSSWVSVNDFWSNMAISALAYDPTNTQVFYAGTGEGYGNLDAVRGNGIWKTTDGGTTWSQLSSTANSTFNYVRHLAVNPVNGDVYASTSNGLQRSQDGGVTWIKVLGSGTGASSNSIYKTEISATGTIWVAVRSSGVYRSYSGNASTYTKLNTTSGGFTPAPTSRIEIAIAPSDTNVCYALSVTSTPRIFKTSDGGSTWVIQSLPDDADFGIPANDFTRSQSWYDLTIAVSPINPNHVVVGGVDLFQSKNGGAAWDQLSHWYGGFGYQEIHADQHNILFRQDSTGLCLFSNDGGVAYSPDMSAAAPVLVHRTKDYNTTQFYACAVHPTAGSNYYLAGAQDNGTQQFTTAGINFTTEVTGGDGGFCYIDQDNPQWQLTAYTRNSHNFSADGGSTWGGLNSSDGTGSFINPGDYHDKLNILFTGRFSGSIKRTFINGNLNPNTDDFSSSTSGTTTHITASRYSKNSATLFVGTSSGNVYKIANAEGLSPSTTNITGSNFPNGSISCVALGVNESELLVTFSNYGVNSIWYTSDGGTTWISKEGTLPDMPVRWSLFNPNDFKHAIVATELGVWECTDLSAANPVWTAANNGLANVRVDMLQIRGSDGTVAAATHARGLFTMDAFFNPNPVANIGSHREILCENEEVKFSNLTFNATGYQWTVTPNTFNFVNGTSATSSEPEIEFTAKGNYSIKLLATNGSGQDTTSTSLVVGTLPLPFNEDFSNGQLARRWKVVNVDNDITWEERQLTNGTAISVQNFNYVGASILGQKDDLITPPLDFTGVDNPILNFDYAYTSRTTQADSLGIFFSKDCGATWDHIKTYTTDGSSSYITTTPRNFSFTPSVAGQWCGNGTFADCGYIDLSYYLANQASGQIMFRNYSHQGNNIYLGSVDITSSSIGIDENTVNALKVYPNPVIDIVNLDFGKTLRGDIEVVVYNLNGKKVMSLKQTHSSSGIINLNLANLNSGVYMISATADSQVFNSKLIKR